MEIGIYTFAELQPAAGSAAAQTFAVSAPAIVLAAAAERITWSGRHRPALDGLGVYPRPLQQAIPVWVAVGGNPEPAASAAGRRSPASTSTQRRHCATRASPAARSHDRCLLQFGVGTLPHAQVLRSIELLGNHSPCEASPVIFAHLLFCAWVSLSPPRRCCISR